jgi:AcrR family transcriptional regulator
MAASGTERVKTKRYHDKRERVIDVVVELFSKNGYASTGMTEICDATGLARGALYYYIGSKEALLAEIHDRVMDPLLSEAGAIAELGLGFEARLRLLSESLLWQIIHRHDHVWVFLHEFPALTGERATMFRKRRGEYEKRVEAVLRAGVDSGDFREVDPWLTARAWFGMHNYTYLWLKPGGRLTAKDVAEPFAAIFMQGIATPKRRR